MLRSTRLLLHGLFSAATIAALGFGGAQAFAAPTDAAPALSCNPSPNTPCDTWCKDKGYDYGVCITVTNCRCYFY